MLEFLESLLEESDFRTLLGDMFEPACACILVGFCLISFAACCSMFIAIIKGLFGGR